MIFDDGSTISDDGMTSTDAPSGSLVSDYYGNNSGPGSYSPGASSWLDVLNNGINHYASYKAATRPASPNPQATTYANAAAPAPATVQNWQALVKWGLIGLVAIVAVRAVSRG